MADNYDRWLEHELASEALEEKLPVCDMCGGRIWDDYYYDLDGEIICEDCIREYFDRFLVRNEALGG